MEACNLRMGRLWEEFESLLCREHTLKEEVDRLVTEKADVRQLDEANSVLASAMVQLQALDDAMPFVKRQAESATDRIDTVEGSWLSVEQSVAAMSQKVKDFGDELVGFRARVQQEAEQDRCDVEEEQRLMSRAFNTLTENFETTVTDLRRGVAGLEAEMNNLACKSEVEDVKKAMLSLESHFQQESHGQQVLFGARCLSCNREYDEVQKTPGGVDVIAEKQRSKLCVEVERALRCSKTDPGKPIKLLAVKVGRPSTVACPAGLGPAAARTAGYACQIDDVQFAPAPSEGSTVPTRAQATPETVCSSPLPCMSEPPVQAWTTLGSANHLGAASLLKPSNTKWQYTRGSSPELCQSARGERRPSGRTSRRLRCPT